jgi:hypothetical protein
MAVSFNSRSTIVIDLNTYFFDKTGKMTYSILPDRNPYNNVTLNGSMLSISGEFRGTSYLVGIRASNSYGLYADGFIPVTEPAQVNCQVSQYPEWNTIPCTPNGTKTRTRRVTVEPLNGGTPCPNDMSQTIACDFDCVVNPSKPWKDRSPCYTSGWQYEEPNILHHPKNNGRACPATRVYPCAVNCQYSWGDWSSCDQSHGTQYRDPNISVTAKNGGAACPGRESQNCKVNCQGWWGGCSRNCEGSKGFNVTVWPKNGGWGCPGTESCGGSCARGSYRITCRNERREGHEGHDLVAECERMNRTWMWSRINAHDCNGRDIANIDGTLRC